MQVKIQVVTISDDGQETTRDIDCVERQDLTPETLGLSLAEGKAVLQALQEVVVEWQMQAYLQQQRACPHCGKARRSKGVHHMVFQTVFGTLPVGVRDSTIVPARRMRPQVLVPWPSCFRSGQPPTCSTWKPNGRR